MRAQDRMSRGACLAAVLALGASALGAAGPAWADAKASRACRGAIAKGMNNLAAAGFKAADDCHKAADKAVTGSGACNDVLNGSFDPKNRYGKAHTKATAGITAKCQVGDPVLSNYSDPPLSGPDAVVGGHIDESVGGNSTLVQGAQNLSGDKAKIKCRAAIGKYRTSIVKEILKNSIKCQTGKDKTLMVFDVIDPSCVNTGPKSSAAAITKIPAACGALDGAADLGTCSPLPGCVISAAQGVAQDIAAAIYKKVPPPSVCGNGTLEGSEQCDHGLNNGTPGDTCSAQCESLVQTCGPGTPAGGSITGHRMITVNLTVPPGSPLAGVRVGFDYPQLSASIKGSGVSSVVQNSFQVLAPTPPDGYLSTGFDSDLDAGFVITSVDDFIASGPLVQVTLDQCVALSQNICSRSQNVVGCCTAADVAACEADPEDFTACQCGIKSGVTATDCANAPLGACTVGACSGAPTSASTVCSKKCTAGAYSKLNPSAAACTTNANCDAPPHCDDPGTLTCTDGDPAKFGAACTAATEATDCGPSPAGVCSSGTFCLNGAPSQIGLACSIKNDCGAPLDFATCQACPQLGDRTNATFGCLDITNPPVCAIGKFPPVAVGACVPFGGPVNGCPSNNVCETQAEISTESCTVTDPVNHLGQVIGGVTCQITVTEAP
jgi:cysteine-rich repeat protein